MMYLVKQPYGSLIDTRIAASVIFVRAEDDWIGQSLRPFLREGWDGERARAVTPETIEYCKRLLAHFPQIVAPPAIAPGIDGSLGMLWDRANVYLYVDVL